jgi:hypothetical protein
MHATGLDFARYPATGPVPCPAAAGVTLEDVRDAWPGYDTGAADGAFYAMHIGTGRVLPPSATPGDLDAAIAADQASRSAT